MITQECSNPRCLDNEELQKNTVRFTESANEAHPCTEDSRRSRTGKTLQCSTPGSLTQVFYFGLRSESSFFKHRLSHVAGLICVKWRGGPVFRVLDSHPSTFSSLTLTNYALSGWWIRSLQYIALFYRLTRNSQLKSGKITNFH